MIACPVWSFPQQWVWHRDRAEPREHVAVEHPNTRLERRSVTALVTMAAYFAVAIRDSIGAVCHNDYAPHGAREP